MPSYCRQILHQKSEQFQSAGRIAAKPFAGTTYLRSNAANTREATDFEFPLSFFWAKIALSESVKFGLNLFIPNLIRR